MYAAKASGKDVVRDVFLKYVKLASGRISVRFQSRMGLVDHLP
jgi:hypothetical protein